MFASEFALVLSAFIELQDKDLYRRGVFTTVINIKTIVAGDHNNAVMAEMCRNGPKNTTGCEAVICPRER